MAPRPTEITAVAKILDPSLSDDAKIMAREIIEKMDELRLEREQWIVSIRNGAASPVVSTGPWTTKNQAMKAAAKVAFVDDPNTTPGVGWFVHRMMPPPWLDSL